MVIAEIGDTIADDFVEAAALAGIAIPRPDIEVYILPAPHRPPSSLPIGKFGVYAFMFGDRCLKVGKAGPNSTARFCSQHYGTNAPSTLAKSLLKLQSSVGATGLDITNVKAWICENTARINFLIPSRHGVFALSLLEAFVQCRLRPEYEGFASQRSPSNDRLHRTAR
ncbi:MAG: hypothetical protein M3410_16765 [Acidobacteriota bacterium]|nr:hypothetical protein [Acidobacteriota bacterium]